MVLFMEDAVTPLDRLFFRVRLKGELLERTGTAFQDLFASIMEIAHPADFVRVAPWGHAGDLKNDGYLPSEETLFQCYAPKELGAAKTISKITEDLAGAAKHWKGKFKRWAFVHNNADGAPAPVLQSLLELGKKYPTLTLCVWGQSEIETRLLLAPRDRIVRLLGEPFAEADLAVVGFEEIKLIADHLQTQAAPADEAISPVPSQKLAANALSPEVGEFLRVGMRKSTLVGKFFREYYDATLGDRAALAFKTEYQRLRAEGLLPDMIFYRLHTYARGPLAQEPRIEAAILSVLAYLFEECDIFEPVPGGGAQ